MKDLEVKKESALTPVVGTIEDLQDVLGSFKVDSSDILIPKILLMQPTSDMVTDGVATIGDFRNSVTKEKMGTIVEPFEFVPFYHTKTWDIHDPNDNNKWLRSEEFNAGDESLAWEFKEDGRDLKRVKRVDLYGFIPSEVEKGRDLPVILSFKSTSYREVTKILTEMKLNASKKKLPWATYFNIGGEKIKNEDNQVYCVIKANLGGETPLQYQKLCLDWWKNIKGNAVKVSVDNSDVSPVEEVRKETAKDVSGTGKY